jgi:hypothetical protein
MSCVLVLVFYDEFLTACRQNISTFVDEVPQTPARVSHLDPALVLDSAELSYMVPRIFFRTAL